MLCHHMPGVLHTLLLLETLTKTSALLVAVNAVLFVV